MISFTFVISFKILPPNSGAERMRDEESNTQIPVTKSPTPAAISNHSLPSVWLLPVSGLPAMSRGAHLSLLGTFWLEPFWGMGASIQAETPKYPNQSPKGHH